MWLLVLSLVAAQLLGMMHRISHAPAVGDHRAAIGALAATATDRPEASGWLAGLFGAHAGNDASCKLYDAHGQAGAPPVLMLSLPAAEICLLVRAIREAPSFPTRAPFEARAPPFFR